MFGPEDEFFNQLAALARVMPVLPLFGSGAVKLQPVYVGDVAEAAFALTVHLLPRAAIRKFRLIP